MNENKNTEEDIFEAVPQNFPQLLLLIHRQATIELAKANYQGFIDSVKSIHQQLSSFHDKQYLNEKSKLDNTLQKSLKEVDKEKQLTPHEIFMTRTYITKDWAMDLLGLLSSLEGRKGLLVEKITTLEDE